MAGKADDSVAEGRAEGLADVALPCTHARRSMAAPLLYYRNVTSTTILLLEAMEKHGVTKLV